MSTTKMKYIGYWMSKKKSHKINWVEFRNVCNIYGFDLIEVDLERSLETQGPFHVFLHKLTDIIALAGQGDLKSKVIIDHVEQYIKNHPEIIVVDPLENVRILLDRYRSYSIIENSDLAVHNIFTPKFVDLITLNSRENIRKLTDAGIKYPFVCKPLVAHGSKKAHKMSIIFHENYLADCDPPCVAQTFVNHNAILYKIFVVGDRYYVVERPSLKNFEACDRETIFFDSHDISKAASQSTLSVLDPKDVYLKRAQPDMKKFVHIVATLRKELGMALFGVDVIIENDSEKYYIVDINAYPGYDGYPDFFNDLMFFMQSSLGKISYTTNDQVIKNAIDSCSLLNHKHILTIN